MHCLAGRDRVIAWLKKNGWPEPNGANQFKWCLSPDTGKVPEDGYSVWDGSWDSIPKDKKVILRRVGLKSYTHVHLDSEEGISEKKGQGQDPQPASAMIVPPEIAREKRQIAEERAELDKYRESLREWEKEIRNQNDEVRKSHMMAVKIQREQDARAESTESRLKQWGEHLDKRKSKDQEDILILDGMAEEMAGLREKQVIAASLTHVIDKVAGSFAIRGLKNLSDEELKKLPPGFMDDLGKFIAHQAESRMFRNVPEPYLMVGDSFERLPNNDDKLEFCRIVLRWLLSNNQGSFMQSVAMEWKEEQRAKSDSQ